MFVSEDFDFWCSKYIQFGILFPIRKIRKLLCIQRIFGICWTVLLWKHFSYFSPLIQSSSRVFYSVYIHLFLIIQFLILYEINHSYYIHWICKYSEFLVSTLIFEVISIIGPMKCVQTFEKASHFLQTKSFNFLNFHKFSKLSLSVI